MNNFFNRKKVFVISEIHPQHDGDFNTMTTMILQSKLMGADAAKVQLYDTQKLHGNLLRKNLQLSKDQLIELKTYADRLGIDLFASVFDIERLEWCEELDFKYHKIASRTVADTTLCEAIIATGKPVFVSLGMWDWQTQGLPFQGDNINYLYCVAKYPALLEDLEMPEFDPGGFVGYSDHTVGIAAILFALSRGAKVVEKHFTLSKANQRSTQKAHLGSMEMNDLYQIRQFADNFALIKTKR